MIPYEELAAALHSRSAPAPRPTVVPATTVIDTHHGHATSLEAAPAPLDDATLSGLSDDPSAELDLGEVLSDEDL